MRAGKLRHRIALDEKIASGDGYTWQLFATVWAEKHPLSAREYLNGGQVLGRAEGFFVIRWITGINPTMRIRDLSGSAVYNIEGVLEDPKSGREWLTLPYSVGTSEG